MHRVLLCATLLLPLPTLAADGWETSWSGYVRAGYEYVQADADQTFVGNNDGFILHNARLNLSGTHAKSGVSFRVGLEGAADLGNELNNPQSELGARLRDGWLRWDPCQWGGLQVGQFKAPFAAEELFSTADLAFVGRSVGIDGVAVGRGNEEGGLGVDRQIGAMLSPAKHLQLGGDVGIGYYLMAASGNGGNQALDDNGKPAYYTRLEVSYGELLTVGGAWYLNERSRQLENTPEVIETTQTGMAGDLLVRVAGAELFAQFAQVKTEHDTITVNPEQTSRALSGQLAYLIETSMVHLRPGYRFAMLEPFTDSDAVADLTKRKVQYHTVGLRADLRPSSGSPPSVPPLSLHLNYTLTGEEAPFELDNDRFEAIAQLVF